MEIGGKTAVVTGGAGGIGRAICDRLADEGAAVAVVDQDEAGGLAVADGIRNRGGNAAFVATDLTQDRDVEAMVAEVERSLGGLDILVNNAGGYDEPVFPDAPLEHWTRSLDLNLRSAMVAIHFAVRAMERRGSGAIVNIASSAGLGLAPHPGPEYAAAKAGVVRLTASLAPLAAHGIRVNCVCPHTVATPAVLRTIGELQADGRELPETLRGVLLEPHEIADAVVGLVRDETLAGRVLVCWGEQPPRLLPPDGPTARPTPDPW